MPCGHGASFPHLKFLFAAMPRMKDGTLCGVTTCGKYLRRGAQGEWWSPAFVLPCATLS